MKTKLLETIPQVGPCEFAILAYLSGWTVFHQGTSGATVGDVAQWYGSEEEAAALMDRLQRVGLVEIQSAIPGRTQYRATAAGIEQLVGTERFFALFRNRLVAEQCVGRLQKMRRQCQTPS